MKVLAWSAIKCLVLQSTGKFSNSKDGRYHVPALKALINWKLGSIYEYASLVKLTNKGNNIYCLLY